MTAAMTSCAIYVRRSHRDAEGTARNGRSLAEQESDGRALAARLGLDVVEVMSEREGTGASARSRKARPVWDAALAALDEGDRFHTVIVWALDRADRRGARQVVELIERHAGTGRRVVGVDGTDTGDERRRLELIIRAEMAREEAENIAKRVERSKRSARTEGRWLGGRPPFGLAVEDGSLVHDPETYPTARRIADEVLAGSTLWAVCQRLNADGIPASRGGSWGLNSLSQLLRAPAFAGLQSFRVRRPDGSWPAIADVYLDEDRQPVSVGLGVITPAERSRILALIESRTVESKRGRRDGRKGTTSFLGHVGRCEACGAPVCMAGVRTSRSYRCGTAINGRVCPGLSAPEAATDEAIADAFLRRLSRLSPGDKLLHEVADRWTARETRGDALEARRAAVEAVDAIEADIARTRRLVVSGVLDEQDAAAEMPRLRGLLASARERLAALPSPEVDVSPLLDLAQSREAWDALPLAERRALLGLAVAEVRITKAGRRGVRFIPCERLLIRWQDGSESRPLAA